nr:hypothetical protein C1892_01600 [Pseudomonas sp. MPBD7-1]
MAGTDRARGRHGVRAELGKRVEYRKGANESTRESAHIAQNPVARELAPAGLRSNPKAATPARLIHRAAWFGAASQPSGSKLPRHKGV